MLHRRSLLTAGAALPLGALGLGRGQEGSTEASPAHLPLIRPPRLRPGDKVGLVNPASAAHDTVSIDIAMDSLRAMELEPVLGPNYFARRGYFAGTDEQRAADVMKFVLDPEIKGIWARGGWGSARVLPHLDFEAIRANPKVIVGYSDSTALLSAIHRHAGLAVFHGPFPRKKYSMDWQRALLTGTAPMYSNDPVRGASDTVQTENRIRTIREGKASGPLLGGNLTVLTSIVGTPYLPDFEGAILFVEDVDEAVYRIDRMMTQLALSGVLGKIAGFVFGRCTDCPPGNGHGSLTLEDVLRDHVEPLGVPAYRGAQFGHIAEQWTLPVGCAVEMDARAGTIRLLEAAVVEGR